MVLGQTCDRGDEVHTQRLPRRKDDVMESTYNISIPLRSRERKAGAEHLRKWPAGSSAVQLDNFGIGTIAHGA